MPKFFPVAVALLSALASFSPTLRAAETLHYGNNDSLTNPRSLTPTDVLSLSVAPGWAATEHGVFSGSGAVTKIGAGNLTLTGLHTYTGATTITAGTLTLAGTTHSPAFVIDSGAVLDFQVASGTRDALVATTTFTGTGTLLKSGTGTLIWTNHSAVFAFSTGAKINVQAGTFAGGSFANENWTANYADLEVAAGALFIGAEANVRVNTLTGAGRITSGYTGAGYQNFTFGVGDGSGTFTGVLANDDNNHVGHYVKTGAGTQILTGANTYTGTTTISGGTLQIGDGGATGSLLSSTITNNSALVFNRSGASTFAGVIEGTGTLAKLGDGTLTLSGDNTAYTGATTISAGTLALAHANALGAGAVSIASGATLDSSTYGADLNRISGAGTLTGSGTYSFNSNTDTARATLLTGSASLIKYGNSTLTLSSANTYTGTTTISGGYLALGANHVLADTTAVIIQANAFLELDGFSDTIGSLAGAGYVNLRTGTLTVGADNTSTTFSGVVRVGTGTLNKSGTGTLTLSGRNSYTGATTISAGTLVLQNNTDSPSFAIASGAVLELNTTPSGREFTNHITYTGAGTLRKTGAGTVLWGLSNGTFALASGSLIDVQAGTFVSDTYGNENWTNNLSDLHVASGATFNGFGANVRVDALTGAGTVKVGNSSQGLTVGVDGGSGTFSGTLIDEGAAGILIKTGAGTQILSGVNTYAGGTTISEGTLSVTSLANGGQDSSIGKSSNAASNLVINGTLAYTGATDQSTDRLFQISGANSTLVANGTGSITFTNSGNLAYGSGGYVLTLAGTNTGANTLAATLTNNGAYYGSVTKIGSGSWTLSGTNTYNGNTTIQGGTLIISGSLGTGTNRVYFGNIANAGTLNFSSSSNQVLTGTISGAGSLIKSGSGTLRISATNSYSGGTTVSSGTLEISSTSALGVGDVFIGSGATVDASVHPQPSLEKFSGTGTLTGSGTFTANATANATINVLLSGSASVVKNQVANLRLTNANTYTGTTTINQGTLTATLLANGGQDSNIGKSSNAASNLILNGGTLAFDGSTDQSTDRLFQLGSTGILSSNNTGSIAFTNAGTLTYGDPNQASTLVLAGTNTGANSLAATITNNGSYSGNVTKIGAGSWTLSGTNTYTGNTTITGGTLTISGSLGTGSNRVYFGSIANAGTLNMASSSNQVLAGGITGSGSLTKSGTGALTLSATNTYSGGTTLNDGTLKFSEAANFGTGNITLNGGILQWAQNTVADLSARLNALVDATLDTNGNDVTFASALSGSGNLTKTGAGTLTLSGNNTYTGTTTITGGTLVLAGTLGSGSYAGAIVNAATLKFSSSSHQVLSGVISGAGALTKTGTGTLTLSGANTYSGGTTVSNGLLNFSALANFGTGGASLNGGGLQWATGTASDASSRLAALGTNGATFDTNGNNVTLASALSGSGGVTKTGAGTLTLSGNNTYTGTTAITGGTLDLAGTLGSGSYAGAIVNAATLKFSSSSHQILSGVISGAGALTKTGTGTLTLSGDNQNTGGTTITTGSINFSSLNNFGWGSITVNGGGLQWASGNTTDVSSRLSIGSSGATFDTNGNNVTFASTLYTSGSLTKAGAGTLTLSGNGSFYNGRTTIKAGTIALSGGNNRLGSGKLSIEQGATLDLGGTNQTFTDSLTSFSDITAGTINLHNTQAFLNSGTYDNNWTSTGSSYLYIGQDHYYYGGPAGTVYLNGSNDLNNNDYSHVRIYSGTVVLGHANALAPAGSLVEISNGTLDLNGQGSVRAGSLAFYTLRDDTIRLINGDAIHAASFAGDISLLASGEFGGAGNLALSGVISGTSSLTKIGAGTLTLSGANTYTGGTTVNAGTLAAGSTTAFGSGVVRVNAGTLNLGGFAVTNALDVRGGALTGLANYSGTQTLSAAMNYAGTVGGSMVIASGGALNTTGATFTGATTVHTGGQLSGTGSLGDLTLLAGSTLSPGNSPGQLTVTGNTTWNGGANYVWQVQDATGLAGVGYDLVSISGRLTIADTNATPFTLSLVSLGAAETLHFNSAVDSSYTIARASGGIFGFSADAFTINATGFTADLNGGTWSLSLLGNNLNLNFTAAAIPEPSTYAMIFGALVLALAIHRKRQRSL